MYKSKNEPKRYEITKLYKNYEIFILTKKKIL